MIATSRRLRVIAAVVLASGLASPARMAFGQAGAPEAKQHLAAGDKAAKAKDWVTALGEYKSSAASARSAAALEGIANSYYELKRSADAYGAYKQLLDEFGKTLLPKSRTTAEARLKELGAQTGSVEVKVGEAGAAISIDDAAAGTSPLPAPVRVSAGAHKVKVTKDGFVTGEDTVQVAAGSSSRIEISLQKESTTAHVVVKEKGGQKVRVLVDGVDVGAAPWEGDVPPGSHEFAVRSSTASGSQRIDVARAKTTQIEIEASSSVARLEVTTSDRLGTIKLDGKEVGEGTFGGELPAGKHVISVTRDGFEPFEKTIELTANHTVAETVTLKAVGAVTTQPVSKADRADEGWLGGFGVLPVFEPGGSGSNLQARCTELGAVSCTSPSTFGGGGFGYFGYTGNPIGLELMLGMHFDQTSATATFSGTGTGNPLSVGVPREEDFKFYRFGGLANVRVRLSAGGQLLRGSLAAGVGAAYRTIWLQRDARSTDGQGLSDQFSPPSVNYWSPSLTVDLSLHFRAGASTAIVAGMFVWMETAGGNLRTDPDGSRLLTSDTKITPLLTPSYLAASGFQAYLGPYLGMQFGP